MIDMSILLAAALFQTGQGSGPRPELVPVPEMGRTVVTLAISDRGRVTDCRVKETSGQQELDAETCRLAQGVRYRPARDDAGQPVVSTIDLPVRWTLPTAQGSRASAEAAALGTMEMIRSLSANQFLITR